MSLIRAQALLLVTLVAPMLMAILPEQSSAQMPRSQQARQKMDPAQLEQKMQERLGLSSEQAKELKTIRERSLAQGKALHEQTRQKREAVMEYLKSPDANEATALRMNNELNDLYRRLGELRIKTWFDMREHLSPEQLKKMDHFPGAHGHRGGMREPGR